MADDESMKRVTVLFNEYDWSLIEAEIEHRKEQSGYDVKVADVLRDIVRTSLGGDE